MTGPKRWREEANVPLLFRDPREVEVREHFNPDCEISIKNFVRIIGKTAFKKDDWVACQIRKPDNRMCGTKFGDGWVALNQDGDEGYIGCVCADRDFQASSRYQYEKRRVEAHFAVLDHIALIEEHLKDRPTFERRAADVAARAEAAYRQAEGLRESLPRKIVECLIDRHRTANNRLSVFYEYLEKQDDGRLKSSWAGKAIASIGGLPIIDFKTTLIPNDDARKLLECLKEVRAEASAGRDKLKRWSETLGTLSRVEAQVESAEGALRSFTKIENLKSLLLLTSNYVARDEMALFILRRQGNREATMGDARELVDEFDDEIRAANKGRDFKIR